MVLLFILSFCHNNTLIARPMLLMAFKWYAVIIFALLHVYLHISFSLSRFFHRHAIACGIMIMVTYRVRLFHRQFFYQILVFLNTLAKLLSKIGRCGSCILIAIQSNGNWIIWISWTGFLCTCERLKNLQKDMEIE